MIRIIAKRYAKALLELAEEKGVIDKTLADLAGFVEAVNEVPALQKLLESPVFTPDDKKSVITALAAKMKMQKTTTRFLEYLAEADRIKLIKEVNEAFQAILADRQNRAVVKFSSAAPVSATDLTSIKKKLESITGKKVDIDAQVDPSLIGGAKAQIGSVIYDGTIKNQIDKIRIRLLN